MPSRPLTTTLLLTIALSAMLAGCGRRGPLEPPPSSVAPQSSQDQSAKKETPPDRHFILDPLIQ
jgi:predicted small lipoprotein YifL